MESKEYFITRYEISDPDCRITNHGDIQVGKKCFTSSCDTCQDRGSQCLRKRANRLGLGNVPCSGPDRCLTDPCPEAKTEPHCRAAIGKLTGKGKQIFEKKSGILETNLVLSSEEDLDLSDLEAGYNHDELIRKYEEMDNVYFQRRGEEDVDLGERDPAFPYWFRVMKKCQQTADKIKSRQNAVATPEHPAKAEPAVVAPTKAKQRLSAGKKQERVIRAIEIKIGSPALTKSEIEKVVGLSPASLSRGTTKKMFNEATKLNMVRRDKDGRRDD